MGAPSSRESSRLTLHMCVLLCHHGHVTTRYILISNIELMCIYIDIFSSSSIYLCAGNYVKNYISDYVTILSRYFVADTYS